MRTFLTDLGTMIKDNALWWGSNSHTIEWLEKEYLNQRVPGTKAYLETWTRKLRQLGEHTPDTREGGTG